MNLKNCKGIKCLQIKAYRRERRQELISKYSLQVAVLLMVLTCGAIFFLTESMRADENRGCIASAYQATQNGGDLEANLAVCN